MLLKASSSSSLLSRGENLGPLFSSVPLSSSTLRFSPARNGSGFVVCATRGSSNHRPLTGVVFEPFEEVKKELDLVPTVPDVSIARQKYTDESEAAINEQINVEYNVSYVYHALFAYFDRDNVALKGLAKFFEESSEEERDHAEKFMKYQNKRGGKVKLQSILMPLSEFDHAEKGDALYAMELALSLEKLTNEKLLNLHSRLLRRTMMCSCRISLKVNSWVNRWKLSRKSLNMLLNLGESGKDMEFGTSIRCCFTRRRVLFDGAAA